MTRSHRRVQLWAWVLIAIGVVATWVVSRAGGAP